MQEVSVIKRRRVGRSGQQLARFRIVWFVVLERRLLYDAHKPSSMVADPQYTNVQWLATDVPRTREKSSNDVKGSCCLFALLNLMQIEQS